MDKEDKIMVSICCLTYNHSRFIQQCLEGFLAQKCNFSFEVLIHDDASTDDTQQIIKTFEEKYPTIIKPIYQKENQYSKGIKPTLKYNFPRAKGKYIAICEGDDYWTDAHKLQKQVDFLEQNPDYVMCSHDITAIDENGDRLPEFDLDPFHKTDINEEQLVLGNKYAYTTTLCYRNILTDFPEEFLEVKNADKFLLSLLGNYGKCKWLGNDISNAMYRVHAKGIWSLQSDLKKRIDTFVSIFWIYQYYNRIESAYAQALFFKLINLCSGWSNEEYTKIDKQLIQKKRLELEIKELKNGISYKLGRLLTKPFRFTLK